jgi:hypothetical protein
MTLKLKKSSRIFKPQVIANACYGLKCMSNKHVEVRELLGILTDKIQEMSSTDIFYSSEIGMTLSGLQNMDDDSEEVLKFLSIMTSRIEMSSPTLSGRSLASSLYGLKSMSSKDHRVRRLLFLLCEVADKKIVLEEGEISKWGSLVLHLYSVRCVYMSVA